MNLYKIEVGRHRNESYIVGDDMISTLKRAVEKHEPSPVYSISFVEENVN